MEHKTGLLYSSKLPVLTSRYAQPRPRRLPRIMESVNNEIKSVIFYKNGDKYFQGHHVIITQRKYRSFDSLLTELTRVTRLPHGVRCLLTPTSGRRVDSLEELEDGKSYIASSYSKLRRINYGNQVTKNDENNSDPSSNKRDTLPRKVDNIRLKPLHVQQDSQNREHKKRSPAPTNKVTVIKPRLITVIRNGFRPRRIVKVLLNRRTAQTFEQVLDDVTSAVGVIGGSGVRKLYTVDGKVVQGLSDLFNSETQVFIAVGDEKFNSHDLQDILRDSNVDHPEHVKHKHRKKSKHHSSRTEDSSIKTASSSKDQEESGIYQNESTRGTLRDDASVKSVGSNKNSIKSKHLKLPDIREHGAHLKPKNDGRRNSSKNDNEILPPIDLNNNQDTPDTQRLIHENSSSQKSPKRTTSNAQVIDAIEKKPETIEKKSVGNIRDLFDIGKKLGDGNFAVVRECFHKGTNEKYAMKIIDRSKLKGKEKMLEDEIRIMKHCNHPNIVKLLDDFHASKEIYLIMELISGGDLFDEISTAVKFSESVAANYVHDICSSLQYLHKRKIVHRDLKPENLLVSHFCIV